ncbi:MAG: recombination regulator RecX [Burkholderiales bacterium]|jgi:regulatory protein|nr:recombination regulator RecX [Burkholderiales bacterium]
MKKQQINLKNKALDFLSRRDYGYHELYVKLQKYSEDLDEIKQVLDDLKHKNFLSEERFISNYLRSKQSKYGLKKIRYDLLQKNVDANILEEVLANNHTSDEYEVAYNIWQRKFGMPATENKERLKQIRFLQSRGFSPDVITKIIKHK